MADCFDDAWAQLCSLCTLIGVAPGDYVTARAEAAEAFPSISSWWGPSKDPVPAPHVSIPVENEDADPFDFNNTVSDTESEEEVESDAAELERLVAQIEQQPVGNEKQTSRLMSFQVAAVALALNDVDMTYVLILSRPYIFTNRTLVQNL